MPEDISMSFGDEPVTGFDEAIVPEEKPEEVEDPTRDEPSDQGPTDEELLQFAEDIGAVEVQDEQAEMSGEERYARYLKVLEEVMPLPEGFPTSEERAEITKKFGRLRIRRVGKGEAYLVRPIRRVDMPTFYRIQTNAATAFPNDAVGAELWFENELAKAFCLFPKITDDEINGTGPLAMGGTLALIARDILAISNMASDADIGMVEDL